MQDPYKVLGLEKGESDKEALQRECREEISVNVTVGSFFCKDKYQGQMNYFYFPSCAFLKNYLYRKSSLNL